MAAGGAFVAGAGVGVPTGAGVLLGVGCGVSGPGVACGVPVPGVPVPGVGLLMSAPNGVFVRSMPFVPTSMTFLDGRYLALPVHWSIVLSP